MSCVLADPTTQKNGRSGQAQCGVDVYGYRNRDTSKLVGIQCKQKLEAKVTATELRAEVKKAKKFSPKVTEFILATTAPRDESIQSVARAITAELASSDHPMIVAVWGWDDIEDHVSQYEEACNAFDPTYSPFAKKGFERMEVAFQQTLNQIRQEIRAGSLSSTSLPVDTNTENTPLHGKITAFVGLIEDGYVELALGQLEKMRTNDWANASRSERYRILVAIASARLKEGADKEAGQFLLEAYAEFPEHKRAKQNRAKGFLLSGQHEKAREAALELLSTDSNNADAAGTLIQARISDTACLNALENVSPELFESEDVLVSQIHFLRCRHDHSWTSVARASARKFPQSRHIQVMAAEALLVDLVESNKDALAGAPVTIASKEELRECVETLRQEALDAINKGYKIQATLANNAALALRFVDDISTAIQILDVGIRQNPQDELLKHLRAVVAYSQNDLQKVLELTPEEPSNPEAVAMRATALADTGRPDEAIKLIDEFDAGSVPEHVKLGLLSARCHAYLVRGEKDLAVDTARREVLSAPDNLTVAAVLIRTLYLAGDNKAASNALDEAVSRVNDATPISWRLLLSFEAQRLDRNDAIVTLLKGRIETSYESEALRLLIAASINGQLWVAARETLEGVSSDLQGEKWVQQARTILALNTGAPDSDQNIGAYLRNWPNDAQMILARIGTWQRTRRDNDISALVSTLNYETLEGSPEVRIRVAAIALHHGGAESALRYAYSVLMDSWDSAKAHLAYHGTILLNEHIGSLLPSSDLVAENTVVYLANEDGSEHKYRVEQRSYKFFADERVDIESDLGVLLKGRRVGDTFVLQRFSVAKPVTVKAIKPTYLDALHRSLDQFNERFPRANGMIKVKFDATAEDPLEDMRQITRERAESDGLLLERYKSSAFPLSFVAGMMGRDPLEALAGLPSVGIQFQVCRGISSEREEAFRSIRERERKGCVVDAITLSIIRRLKLIDAVVSVCGPIFTTQTVFDLFVSRALESKLNVGKQMGFLSWRDGQLVLQEYSEEMLKKAAQESEGERAWAFANVATVAVMPTHELSAEIRAVVEIVGRVASDPAIAAEGTGLLLLSDDMGYRQWATDALKVAVTWLQPVLMVAKDKGLFSEEEYFEAVNLLTLSGHFFTSQEPGSLAYQARKDNFELTEGLRRLVEAIGGPHADVPRNCGVAATFLNQVIEECPEDLKIARIASQVFTSMTNGRMENQRAVVRLVVAGIKKRKDWFLEHATGWLAGHSIGMPDFEELVKLHKRAIAQLAR